MLLKDVLIYCKNAESSPLCLHFHRLLCIYADRLASIRTLDGSTELDCLLELDCKTKRISLQLTKDKFNKFL